MMDISSYRFSTLRTGDHTLYRGDGTSLDPILLVAPAGDRASGESVKRLEHEYSLQAELHADWAARPVALTRYDDRMTLVLEDPGGEPLDRLLGQPLEITKALSIAIPLADALHRLHERGLIHKDIKPANVLVDPAGGRAWLTGFGVASRLPREHRTPEPPEVIAGTLAYMAPEQTGRMNRSIDSRSDLYALGVTLYELLTGTLPFTASDPIELIHCHIAREPIAPSEHAAAVPAQLSAIVMRLLAKTAEERYQTAAGVAADLRRCLEAWRSTGRIDPFPLGMHDASSQLMIPERLYGREREIATLLAAFDRVATHGGAELVLVSGYSGIGKSSVVSELHKVIVLPRGIFISGKLDRRLDSPYATFAQAFQGLIRQILNGRDDDIARWREAIRDAVGNHGSLLTELIPELVQMIGPQPPVAVLSHLETQIRFQSVFQRFVGVFARAEHPLVIFIDDLQWLDRATLTLIEYLTTHPDTRHLLLIGAYRDNEVDPAHPLMLTLDAIRKTDARVDEIVLGPLSVDDVNQLLCASLRCASTEARPLAGLVHWKTGGNPFFAGQFLANLAEEGLLAFDPRARSWTWDLDGIGAKDLTDNLVDLMIGRLRRLPTSSQEALKLLACLGNQADFATLANVHGGSDERMHASFRAAIRAGAIFAQGDGYRFLHDRIQEAAYALIPTASRADHHLRIGTLLLKEMTEERLAEKIFDIVNQLNLGAPLLSDWTDKQRAAELNLRAGRKAKASTAYNSACSYLAAGMAALADHGWQRCYDLALGLYLERAECEILASNLEQAAGLIDELLLKGRSKVDRAEAYRLRMLLQLKHGGYAPAVGTALECLRMFDVDLPADPTPEQVRAAYDEFRRDLGERAIQSLVDLPLMDDPEIRAVMALFNAMGQLAYHTDTKLFQMIVCWMVKLTLRHGTSEFATITYGALALFLGPVFHRFKDGEDFSRLAVAVADRHGFAAHKAGAHFLMQMAILWTRPIETGLTCLEAALRSAGETGEMIYACYSHQHRVVDLMARGDPLDQVWLESVAAFDFVGKHKFGHVVVLSIQAFVQSLRGRIGGGPPIDEAALEARVLRGGVAVVICFHWILQLQRHFLLGSPETALEFAEKAEPLLWSACFHIQSVDYCLYQSLALAAVFPTAPPERQAKVRAALAANLESLQRWAESCPATFAHKHILVAAEAARLDGRDIEAMRLYERAIRSAAELGFVQDQALANELAARCALACGLESVAQTYLRAARDGYSRWGALAKVAQLDQRYPGIRQPAQPPQLTTIEAPVGQLDLATVARTSHAVASEVVPEKLIETLMVIAVEHAGADRGLLVLPKAGEQWIEAEARSDRDTVRVRTVGAPAAPAILPISIVQHVITSREPVILDDARAQNPFSTDDYIRQKRARSLLCLPMVKQAELIGVLYLENNLASHVFTPARIAVLTLLSSQAAISLQNARLYADLINENRDRQTAEEALRASESALSEAQRISHTGSWRWKVATTGEVLSSAELLRIHDFAPTAVRLPNTTFLERLHPEDRPSFERVLGRAVRDRRRFEHEYRIVLPDGSIKHLQAVGQPHTTESGEVEFVGTVMDITERKCSEEALRNAELELTRVARLTTMGELVASIAHEINQPLAAIATNAGACLRWLDRGEPDLGEARAAASRIAQDASRASDVIRGLRALATKSGPQLTRFDVDDAILEVVALTRSELQQHGVALRTRLFANGAKILGDRVQLQQVLLNLIMNAVEAMSAVTGQPKLLAITSEISRRGDISVAIADTGTGLDPATTDRIFDPFFTTKPNGMGMGLSICRSIIETHGGRLWAAPNPPQGTSFQFTLPMDGKHASSSRAAPGGHHTEV
jgi:predicted ATPase/signal transduction histidine kinase